MLRKYAWRLLSPDANTEGGSSTPSTPESANSKTDANTPSSGETPAAEAPGEDLDSILKNGFEESIAKEGESPTPNQPEEGSDLQQLKETSEEKPEAGEEGQEQTPAEEQEPSGQGPDVPGKPIPYERFQQVIQERNEVRQQLTDLQPKAEMHERLIQYCQENNISNDDYAQALEIAALLKNDPTQAWARLKPIVEGLGVLSGDTLPADLAKDVEEGALTQERAKEIAQLRAQAQFREKSQKVSAEQQARKQQQDFVQSVHKAWTSWDASKRKANPDFKPGGNGLWELVNDRLTAMGSALGPDGKPLHPIRSPQDAVKLAEEAYNFVMKTAKKFTPVAGARRALSSNGSGKQSTNGSEDLSFEATLKQRAKELGIA